MPHSFCTATMAGLGMEGRVSRAQHTKEASKTCAYPTLSPVASLCFTCDPSQSGNFPDFQHRQTTHFSPALISRLFTTLGELKSMAELIFPAKRTLDRRAAHFMPPATQAVPTENRAAKMRARKPSISCFCFLLRSNTIFLHFSCLLEGIGRFYRPIQAFKFPGPNPRIRASDHPFLIVYGRAAIEEAKET